MKTMLSNLYGTLNHRSKRWCLAFFGNTIGFRTNALYSAHHALSRLSFAIRVGSQATSSEALKSATRFAKNGFISFAPYLPETILHTLTLRADRLFSDPKNFINNKNEGVLRLKHSFEEFPELEQFITPAISDVIEAYFGSHFKIFSTDIYRTLPTVGSDLMDSCFWHFDNIPGRLIKLIVYLDDTYRTNGAFRLKPKALSTTLKKSGYWDRRKIDPFRKIFEDETSTKIFEGKAGTAILFQSNGCVHKATPPEIGHRDVAAFLMLPSPSPWRENLEKKRHNLSKNFGPCMNPFTDRPLRYGNE